MKIGPAVSEEIEITNCIKLGDRRVTLPANQLFTVLIIKLDK